MKLPIPYIIIIILVVIIVFLKKCDKTTFIDKTIIVVDTSYVHDTINITGKTKIKPIPFVKWIHDTIIDSSGKVVITDHKKFITPDTFTYKTDSFTIKFYTKIYSDCPLDSINNSLIADIRHKIIEKTITKEIVRKNAFFVGPSIGFNKTSGFLTLNGLYERKGKVIYNAGVSMNNKLEPMINVGVYFYISK